MDRRTFVSAVAGGLIVWPLAAHAQRQVLPVIGYLANASAAGFTNDQIGFAIRGSARSPWCNGGKGLRCRETTMGGLERSERTEEAEGNRSVRWVGE